jgi:hypothetical protein
VLAYQRMLHDITPLRRMIIEMSYETWPQVGWATTPEATAIVKQRSCAAVELSLAKLEAVQASFGLAALPAPCCCQVPARCFALFHRWHCPACSIRCAPRSRSCNRRALRRRAASHSWLSWIRSG